MDIKFCNKCHQSKLLHNFRQCKYASGKLYFKSICKHCEVKYALNYNKNHSKTQDQKIRFSKYKKEWYQQNKDIINFKYRERCKNDFTFKVRKNVSRAINRALKKMSSKKPSTIMQYLPYSIDELKIHLESMFDNKMSWNNYGYYWEIDHIIPQSCLLYATMTEDNFKKCWALENLRPLEIHQNRADGSTRVRHTTNIFNGVINE